jgi:translocation and assembly module TamA
MTGVTGRVDGRRSPEIRVRGVMRQHSGGPAFGLLLTLLLALPVRSAPSPAIVIEGVEDEVAANVRAYLSLNKETCDAPLWRLRGRLRQSDREVRDALQAFGYYRSTFTHRFEPAAGKDACWKAVFTITPGPRVSFGIIDVTLLGDAATDTAFEPLVQKAMALAGQPLRQDVYTDLKRRIAELASTRGYVGGRYTQNELRVDPARGTADIILHYDSGPRFSFGPIRREQDIIDPKLLDRFLAYKEGKPYDATLLTRTTRALTGSGYFRNAYVQPHIDEAADEAIPTELVLSPSKRNRYTGKIGYATDTGPRVGVGYQNRRVNRAGHVFSAETSVSKVLSQITAAYTIPLKNPVTDKLKFETGYKHEDTDTSKSDTTAASVTWYRVPHEGWSKERSLTLGHEEFEVGNEKGKSTVLMPGIGWSRVMADNRLYPRKGARLGLKLRGATEQIVSTVSFAQAIGNAKGVLALPGKLRVITRLDVGATAMKTFEELPASVRFFAGGDNSIRGYAYQSLGPKDSNGDVVGGRNLLVGSIELERLLVDKWAVALFADSGNAFDQTHVDPHTGVGFGIRWRSPVGPVRLDIAHPLTDSKDLFRIHFSMGPEL